MNAIVAESIPHAGGTIPQGATGRVILTEGYYDPARPPLHLVQFPGIGNVPCTAGQVRLVRYDVRNPDKRLIGIHQLGTDPDTLLTPDGLRAEIARCDEHPDWPHTACCRALYAGALAFAEEQGIR